MACCESLILAVEKWQTWLCLLLLLLLFFFFDVKVLWFYELCRLNERTFFEQIEALVVVHPCDCLCCNWWQDCRVAAKHRTIRRIRAQVVHWMSYLWPLVKAVIVWKFSETSKFNVASELSPLTTDLEVLQAADEPLGIELCADVCMTLQETATHLLSSKWNHLSCEFRSLLRRRLLLTHSFDDYSQSKVSTWRMTASGIRECGQHCVSLSCHWDTPID